LFILRFVKTKTFLAGIVMLFTALFAGATTHVVKSGDNLYRIALNHGVTLSQLQKANPGVSAQSLRIGQKLVIPAGGKAVVAQNATSAPVVPQAAAPAATPTHPAVSGSYEVKAGDNFSKIARENGTTIAALQAANPGVNPAKLAIGQKINLSGSGAAPAQNNSAIAKTPKTTDVVPSTPAPVPSTVPADMPEPNREIVAVRNTPVPTPEPEPAPATTPVVKEEPQTRTVQHQETSSKATTASYRLIKTTRELTLDQVAKENGTTTDKLNALNGWSFSPQTLLAVDSELYVPAQP
jgi:LysM repeat protein